MRVGHEQFYGVNEETGEEYAPTNKNFIQIYTDSMDFIEDIIDENPMAARVLLVLIKSMKSGNNIAGITQKDLALHFGCSERHISNAVKVLVDRKAMRVMKIGKSNAYQININVAWTSTAARKGNKSLFKEEMVLSDKAMGRKKLHFRTIKQGYTKE